MWFREAYANRKVSDGNGVVSDKKKKKLKSEVRGFQLKNNPTKPPLEIAGIRLGTWGVLLTFFHGGESPGNHLLAYLCKSVSI